MESGRWSVYVLPKALIVAPRHEGSAGAMKHRMLLPKACLEHVLKELSFLVGLW